MFFLLFGFGTKVKDLGVLAERPCPRCHNVTRPHHLRTHRSFSLFFVPLLRWHREELDVCPICGHAEEHVGLAVRRAPRLRAVHA